MPLFIVCSICSRNTHIITVWAWLRDGMLSEHERYYGLGMDALFIVYSQNTNVIMVWAWMRLSSYALGTRALPWFGHGCAIVCSRNTSVIMVWAWSHCFWYAFGTRTLLWFGNGCTCYRMLWEHERYSGLGMDALVIACSRNTNDFMVWAWSHYFWYAFGTLYGWGMVALFLVCFRNTNVIMVWAWLNYLSYALLSYALGTRTLLWFGHGCAIVCSRNTNVIMVWAWMHLLSYALRTRTLLWFGHGCFGIRVRSSLKNAMRGIRSISGPRNTSNVWFVPRRPHPERSARCAFLRVYAPAEPITILIIVSIRIRRITIILANASTVCAPLCECFSLPCYEFSGRNTHILTRQGNQHTDHTIGHQTLNLNVFACARHLEHAQARRSRRPQAEELKRYL